MGDRWGTLASLHIDRILRIKLQGPLGITKSPSQLIKCKLKLCDEFNESVDLSAFKGLQFSVSFYPVLEDASANAPYHIFKSNYRCFCSTSSSKSDSTNANIDLSDNYELLCSDCGKQSYKTCKTAQLVSARSSSSGARLGGASVEVMFRAPAREGVYFLDIRGAVIDEGLARQGCFGANSDVACEIDIGTLPREVQRHTFIMPLGIENFEVLSLGSKSIGGGTSAMSNLSLFSLSNFRTIDFYGDLSVVKEEYGAAIGSHIYDSSLILWKYVACNILALSDTICKIPEIDIAVLEKAPNLATSPASEHAIGLTKRKINFTSIELGAGCGLVSIYLQKYIDRVIVTDKDLQLPLLNLNISNNSDCNIHCSNSNKSDLTNSIARLTPEVIEIDWLNKNCVLEFAKSLNSSCTNRKLIIAGDVFYDLDILDGLMRTIECIESAGRRKLLEANIAADSQSSMEEDKELVIVEKKIAENAQDLSSIIIIAQKIRNFTSLDVANEQNSKILQIFNKYNFESSVIHSEGNVKLWRIFSK